MQAVRVKGVSNPMQFPDDMDIDDIREFLRRRFTQQAVEGNQPRDLDPLQATAQAYQPTMQEKFSQGVGSALTSSGLVSDNYQAQNIGKNIGNIAAFSPAGAAFGGDEFGTAAKKGDKLGMALGALEGVGIGGDIAKLAIFGGVLAKSADLGALAKAKKLEGSGANRDEIWKETGWANDRGDWKFEIDDSEMKLNPAGFTETKRPFTDITERNALLSNPYADEKAFRGDVVTPNYPDLGATKVSIKETGSTLGSYDPDSYMLMLSDTLNARDADSTSLHELQHAIQQREGFAGGGSPDFLTTDAANGVLERFNKEFGGLPQAKKNKAEMKPDEYKDWAIKMYSEQLPTGMQGLKFDQYQRLAGEAEARNVQTRMDWTPEQRRETPPWASLDVPEDELIYRKGGGINQSSVLGGVQLGDAAKRLRPHQVSPTSKEWSDFDFDDINREAFGVTESDVTKLSPSELEIKWTDDLDNVEYEIKNSGKTRKAWAEGVDLSTPIDVILEDGVYKIDDGHHRYSAAKILGKDLPVSLQINDQPFVGLAKRATERGEEVHPAIMKAAVDRGFKPTNQSSK